MPDYSFHIAAWKRPRQCERAAIEKRRVMPAKWQRKLVTYSNTMSRPRLSGSAPFRITRSTWILTSIWQVACPPRIGGMGITC